MCKVTINDVAKKSGYGIGTVSRVISGDKSVKESTRKKILKVIEELNYVPNVNGARLRRKHSNVIAVLVPVINHPFFSEFVEDVEKIADDNGYSLLLVTSQMNEKKEEEILLKIRQKEIDGAIFVTHYEHNEEELKDLPLVSIDRHLNHIVPYVSSDNYDSTKNAVEYLISKGAKKIGYVGTKPFVESEVSLREKAYLDVMKEHGYTPYVLNEIVKHGEEEELVDRFLQMYPDVDAVFASGSTVSLLMYEKLYELGKKMPEDVQLISYDGTYLKRKGKQIVSSIEQPVKELAEASFNILVDIINEREVPHSNIYKAKFVHAETTK